MKQVRGMAGRAAGALVTALALAGVAAAQRGQPQPPVVVSPEVKPDRKVTFRIYAPKAESVGVFTSDLPGGGAPRAMKKGEKGVWELTLDPVAPGTYRYLIDVDGVRAVDPRNQAVSESNGNVWSVVHVPGSDFMDTADVPHGAVARVYLPLLGAGQGPPHARLHPAGLRDGRREVPGALPAARGRRQRRLVDVGRPGQLHPGQPDRRQEGQADDRRHAGRAHRAVQLRHADEAGRGRRPRRQRPVRGRLREGHPALRREALPRADRPD